MLTWRCSSSWWRRRRTGGWSQWRVTSSDQWTGDTCYLELHHNTLQPLQPPESRCWPANCFVSASQPAATWAAQSSLNIEIFLLEIFQPALCCPVLWQLIMLLTSLDWDITELLRLSVTLLRYTRPLQVIKLLSNYITCQNPPSHNNTPPPADQLHLHLTINISSSPWLGVACGS